MKHKIVFFDMDGTLYQTENDVIQESALDAIQTLKDKGYIVCAATGRPLNQMKLILQRVQFDYYVLINGSYILDKDFQEIGSYPILQDNVNDLVNFSKKHETGLMFHFGDATYIYNNFYPMYDFCKYCNVLDSLFYDPSQSYHLRHKAFNAVVLTKDKKLVDQFMETHPNLRNDLINVKTDGFCFDIFNADNDKSKGIEMILEKTGFTWQDTICFGDSTNDIHMLKKADIGVAMGMTGTEVAKDAAAMVLTDDNFATIVKAVENGRNIYQNIKNAIQFLLSGNFAAILAVLYASLASLPVPFAPVHLLFINLLTDSLPAIALGLEPHNPEVMKEKPRAMGESILTKPFLTSIGVEGLCIGIMTMTAFMIGYRDGNAVLASTMAFGTLCSSRLVHGFNCKANKPIIFTKRFWNNIYLIGAFVLGWLLITGVLMIPALQGMFKVQTLTVAQLMTVYGLALLNLPVIQLLKWIRTRKK